MQVISDTRKPIKIWTNFVEQEAENQLRNLASLPFIYKHVAVMPDVHAGKGSTVGTVIATHGAIIPAAIGVDIGCGMMAAKLPFPIDRFKELKSIRSAIEAVVPTGTSSNQEVTERVGISFKSLGKPTVCENLEQNGKDNMGLFLEAWGPRVLLSVVRVIKNHSVPVATALAVS